MEFGSCVALAWKRLGRPPITEATPPRSLSSATTRKSTEILRKLGEIDVVLSQLEGLATFKGESQGFERVMETVEVDCRWVDRAVTELADAAAKQTRPQRRDFERHVALHLRGRLTDRTKAVQKCAGIRQKTLKDQRRRRDKYTAPTVQAKVQLDAPLFRSFPPPPPQPPTTTTNGGPIPGTFAAASSSGLRSRGSRHPSVWDPNAVKDNTRLQLQDHQKQQQQMLLMEQASRRRLEHAQNLESEIGNLGDMFSRFSSLVAQQAEVVERLDDDVEIARMTVDAGHASLSDAQRVISGNRGLILKVFGLILVFTFIFIRY